MSRKALSISQEDIDAAIAKSSSMHEASILLGVTYSSFIRYAKKFGLYSPNQGLKGSNKPKSNFTKRLRLDDILANTQKCNSSRLKKMLIDAGIMQNVCEECGISEWQNKPLVIQIDHIDGNSKNNELSNLRMLCPNCHSQTHTYCRGQAKAKPTLKS